MLSCNLVPIAILQILLLLLLPAITIPSTHAQPLSSLDHLLAITTVNTNRKYGHLHPLQWDFDLQSRAMSMARERAKVNVCAEDSPDLETFVKEDEDYELMGVTVVSSYERLDHNPLLTVEGRITKVVEGWYTVEDETKKTRNEKKEEAKKLKRKQLASNAATHIGCNTITGRPARYYCSVTLCLLRNPLGIKPLKPLSAPSGSSAAADSTKQPKRPSDEL
ncbi:hypothetical protein HDU97_001561 [Phlyctochytrium planicorne]|nr:hypothetical protein HDU97_001561 [Phlyctochytrium planicorne]